MEMTNKRPPHSTTVNQVVPRMRHFICTASPKFGKCPFTVNVKMKSDATDTETDFEIKHNFNKSLCSNTYLFYFK